MTIYFNQNIKHSFLAKSPLLIGLLLLVYTISCTPQKGQSIKLNEIQLVGSHNSYKKAIDPELMKIIYQEDSNLAVTLDYEHLPIPEQLDLGMRNLELDIFHDPQGGRYSEPLGMKVIENASSFNKIKMLEPGFKVFHVQDIDFRSHYSTLKEALLDIKMWSDSHPDHIPIIITINLKDEVIHREGFVKPLPFGRNALDSVDQEISSVLGWDKLIYPDLVRGSFDNLEEAVLLKGWPELNDVKGKYLFVLDGSDNQNELYMAGHPALSERVMFINADEGQREAAFMIFNNPFTSFKKIRELVKKGYMVRTRADANTIEARMNDFSRWEKAKESGAQVITTDYYIESTLFKSEYEVGFGMDTVFRFNPIRY